jgi:23S rRNA pseudouridine2605 synthase
MTSDQLRRARRERWRQDGNALLTLDDAERWLSENPLCLVFPRRAHLPIPAPSFVEAVAGKPDETPGADAIESARTLMARLAASGGAVPLNLFGAPGEQPDALAAPDALSYLYALQPDRQPRRAPSITGSGRVSPLALEAWKTLERDGVLTAGEMRERLGREVTEAAVLRALGELWQTLRAVPVPARDAGQPAQWDLLGRRHGRELLTGSTMAQATALSMLASFCLQSAVAATSEEIELFLSPLASRSKIREVIRGLASTRQLGMASLGTEQLYFVEGALPEFPEAEERATPTAAEHAGLEGNEPDTVEIAAAAPARSPAQRRPPQRGKPAGKSFAQRRPPSRAPGFRRDKAPGQSRPGKSQFGRREGGGFAAREGGGFAPGKGGGFAARAGKSDRPFRREPGAARPERQGAGEFRPPSRGTGTAGPGRPFRGGQGTRPPRRTDTRDQRPNAFEQGTARPEKPVRSAFRPPAQGAAGSARPFRPAGGTRPPRRDNRGDQPGAPRAESGFGSERPPSRGFQRPDRPPQRGEFKSRKGGFERKPPSGETGRGPARPRTGERNFGSKGERPPFRPGGKPAFGRSAPGKTGSRPFAPANRSQASGRPAGEGSGRAAGFKRPGKSFGPPRVREREGGQGAQGGSEKKGFGRPSGGDRGRSQTPQRPWRAPGAGGQGKPRPGGFGGRRADTRPNAPARKPSPRREAGPAPRRKPAEPGADA